MQTIPMVNLQQNYFRYKTEIDTAIQNVVSSGNYIGGKIVKTFEHNLSNHLNIQHVIGCGNGTDALQLALMSLNLPKKTKIIVPAFTYIATIEVIKLLDFEPVFCDVEIDSFNTNIDYIKAVYTEDIKVIMPVHLFGQLCNMQPIYTFAAEKNIFIIEDNAQSLGSNFISEIENTNHIITTSFFPTKNLGAFGDGGAVMTNNNKIAQQIKQIANHGQTQKYYHETIGINSRLDTIQAAILNVKLKYLDNEIIEKQKITTIYNEQLKNIEGLKTPIKNNFCNHTYHQYTLQIDAQYRDKLQQFLNESNISSTIYYPIAAYKQKAYFNNSINLENTELLCKSVLSIPIFPTLSSENVLYICNAIQQFFRKI